MRKVDVKEKARARELRILEQWKRDGTFRRTIENREGRPDFVFYDGPPTANGKPHIGHVLGRVLKDLICRYKTMTGYRVVRKAGWDTHGLPVELGVEKQLGISGKQDIEKYGVAEFVEACRASVFEYEKQWRELTEAIAYWTDMDDPYVTLTNDYIESVWHILSTIHGKGLLYQGHRVSPYCPCCQTTLSSHEVAQGYEDVKDLSATVKFRSASAGAAFLAWTTTPWTLPANVALAVHPDVVYAKVKHEGELYIAAASLADDLFKDGYEIVSTHKGAEFVGMSYTPPFGYTTLDKGHIVVAADYVTESSGTGIVHIAPAHGEDDYRTARDNGVDFINLVDASGRYKQQVADYAGRFVKDCDVDIVKSLAASGLLFAKERYEHSYPFCWRCKSPLLYYAMESWFIRTTAVKEQLIANNSRVDWHPAHLRDGRFGKFLEELVDWNISRNRYWGTPLNVWICGDCGEQFSPGSREQLEQRSIGELPAELDLHRPYVDGIKLRCACGGTMERTPEVIDVWFDSGSMPFAQHHHPFGDEKLFRQQYPADMICEAIDQTRGWFFTLLAVSTLYNGETPYKAVLSTGHVLDEDGQKMSKSKGNVIDPWDIIEQFGTDAMRWSLVSDSAPWNNKRFSRTLVAEAKSKIIDTIHNAHAFYTLYASIDGYKPEQGAAASHASPSDLDRWIISRLNSTVRAAVKGLEATDFLGPAKQIEAFVDEMSNWYIRRSRDRFWGGEMTADKRAAYETLREVLLTLSRLIAPYAPLIAEDVYGNLGGAGSVHEADYPTVNETAIDEELERGMTTARRIVELARSVRNDTGIKTRQPLSSLLVTVEGGFDAGPFEPVIKDELNVKQLTVQHNDAEFVDFSLKLNLRTAGKLYNRHVGYIQNALKALSAEEAKRIVQSGCWETTVEGEALRLTPNELLVEKRAKAGYASASGYGITVALNTEITAELEQEGIVRELARAVQDLRKKLDLPVERRIELVMDADEDVKTALAGFYGVFEQSVLLSGVSYASEPDMEAVQIGDKTVRLLVAGHK